MAEIDVKRGTDASRRPEEQGSKQGNQPRGQTGQEMQRAQGGTGGTQGLSSTRGRSRSGLSHETGGWGWPSRSLFSMNPMELWSASPFELMRRMSDEMDRMIQGSPTSGMGTGAGWRPAVEVVERDGKLVVTAELPGLSEKDVRVEATEEGLVIEGERKREHEETGGRVYRSERSYGFFRTVIPLLEDAQVDQAQARFTNGVLEVTVPVPEQSARRRQIPISGGGSATPSQEEGGTRTRG